MKKFVTMTLALATVITIAFAQEDMKPKQGAKGVGMNLNFITGFLPVSLTAPTDVNGNPSLMLRYFIADDMSVRVGFGITSWNNKWNTTDSILAPGLVTMDSTYKKMNIYFAPGIEKHLGESAKLDPYVGAALTIGMMGKTKETSNSESSAPGGVTTIKTEKETAGGFAWGLNLITGFNYFFAQHIAVGAEVMWGINSAKTGGDWTSKTTFTAPGIAATTTNDKGVDKTKKGGLNVSSTAGVNLSFFF